MILFLTRVLRWIAALCLAALLLVVLLVIFKIGTWASEFSEFLLAWGVMLGGALAYAEKSHLGVDILVDKLDAPTRLVAYRLGHILIFAFAAMVMFYGGGKLTLERFHMGQVMPSLGISKGWLYLALPVSGAFVSLISINRIFSAESEALVSTQE